MTFLKYLPILFIGISLQSVAFAQFRRPVTAAHTCKDAFVEVTRTRDGSISVGVLGLEAYEMSQPVAMFLSQILKTEPTPETCEAVIMGVKIDAAKWIDTYSQHASVCLKSRVMSVEKGLAECERSINSIPTFVSEEMWKIELMTIPFKNNDPAVTDAKNVVRAALTEAYEKEGLKVEALVKEYTEKLEILKSYVAAQEAACNITVNSFEESQKKFEAVHKVHTETHEKVPNFLGLGESPKD